MIENTIKGWKMFTKTSKYQTNFDVFRKKSRKNLDNQNIRRIFAPRNRRKAVLAEKINQ